MLWNRYCIIVRISPNWPPRPSWRALAAAGSGSSGTISLIRRCTCRYMGFLSVGSVLGGGELLPHGVLELEPGLLEGGHAVALEGEEDLGEVDPDRLQPVEHRTGVVGVPGDAVAGGVAVVGEGLQRLLRHRADGAGDHQL